MKGGANRGRATKTLGDIATSPRSSGMRPGPRSPQISDRGGGRGSEKNTMAARLGYTQITPGATRRSCEKWCFSVLNHPVFLYFCLFFSFCALFADDFRIAVFPKSVDVAFAVLAGMEMLFFIVELTLRSIAVPPHKWYQRCYVLLDLLNILSLVVDLQFHAWNWNEHGVSIGLSDWITFQTSRASWRAANVVRLLWILRTPRLVAGLMRCMRVKDILSGQPAEETTDQTTVARTLNEYTTGYLVTVVLAMGFVIPWLDGTLMNSTDDSFVQGGLDWLHRLPQDLNSTSLSPQGNLQEQVRIYAQRAITNRRLLLFLDICVPSPGYTNGCLSTLPWSTIRPWVQELPAVSTRFPSVSAIFKAERASDLMMYTTTRCYGATHTASMECRSTAVFSLLPVFRFYSWLNIVKTAFIIAILTFTTILFALDAQRLVIGPIQRMTDMVRRLAVNPLAAINEANMDDSEGGLETMVLEEVMPKISHLLQIGFGAAGAEIIRKNMGAGALNAVMPGKKITSIYGFCDIRQFTDVTEQLNQAVFAYVNDIAEIVHGCSCAYYGMANKNVGDAFLLSWKLCDGVLEGFSNFTDLPDDETRLQANETIRCPSSAGKGAVSRSLTPTEMADSSLAAFLKCKVDMDFSNVKGTLVQYRQHDKVVKNLGADFKVRMGFGMHVGWAVEGAIGSSLKIDATYISPHVDMSDRLEASSKKYACSLIMSHWFVELLSPAAKSYLRPIDCISAKAIPVPITLYTFDIAFDGDNLRPGFLEPQFDVNGEQLPVDFLNHSWYREMQANLHPAFLTSYKAGFECYLDGEWNEAQQLLRDALSFKQDDQPILRLLKTMEEAGYVPPPDWDGSVVADDF